MLVWRFSYLQQQQQQQQQKTGSRRVRRCAAMVILATQLSTQDAQSAAGAGAHPGCASMNTSSQPTA
jgi:hypothetical protein